MIPKDALIQRNRQGCDFSQENIGHDYERSKRLMPVHPEHTEKCKKNIDKCRAFKSEREALEAAIDIMKNNKDFSPEIWATIEKYEDFYYLTAPWYIIVGASKAAGEYIGLYPVHCWSNIQAFINALKKIDETISHH